jgi:hypothetical protein
MNKDVPPRSKIGPAEEGAVIFGKHAVSEAGPFFRRIARSDNEAYLNTATGTDKQHEKNCREVDPSPAWAA